MALSPCNCNITTAQPWHYLCWGMSCPRKSAGSRDGFPWAQGMGAATREASPERLPLSSGETSQDLRLLKPSSLSLSWCRAHGFIQQHWQGGCGCRARLAGTTLTPGGQILMDLRSTAHLPKARGGWLQNPPGCDAPGTTWRSLRPTLPRHRQG